MGQASDILSCPFSLYVPPIRKFEILVAVNFSIDTVLFVKTILVLESVMLF